jgi:hypothetical protein
VGVALGSAVVPPRGGHLTLVVTDSAGVTTRSAPVTVYVDRNGPAYKVENPTEPGWGYYLNVRTPLRLSAKDPGGVSGLNCCRTAG